MSSALTSVLDAQLVRCPYCQCLAELVTGAEEHPNRPDLADRKFWRCVPCGARVGCHLPGDGPAPRDGTVPFGRLARPGLRKLRGQVHAVFDDHWGFRGTFPNRGKAYRWLSRVMELPEAHIAEFDEEQCRRALRLIEDLLEERP